MNPIRLRPQHFTSALILLALFCYFVEHKIIDKQATTTSAILPEVTSANLDDSIGKGLTMVLFYTPGSNLSANMQSRLAKLRSEAQSTVRFYQVHVDESDSLIQKYNISLTPLLLTFKDGKENQRAMGLVPSSNLEIIRDRLIKTKR